MYLYVNEKFYDWNLGYWRFKCIVKITKKVNKNNKTKRDMKGNLEDTYVSTTETSLNIKK